MSEQQARKSPVVREIRVTSDMRARTLRKALDSDVVRVRGLTAQQKQALKNARLPRPVKPAKPERRAG